MRIGLFNVKYSPNLGDGLLSECLETALKVARPDTEVVPLDLAGRSDYQDGGRFRSTALALLEHSPPFARQNLVGAVLGHVLRNRMRPHWKRMLHDLDAVVVGGGNLFDDADLNFPMKIHAALDETREAGIPAAVFGVGLSDNWSPRGEALFRQGLSGVSLVYASVREEASSAIWERRLTSAGIRSAEIAHDPGLLVSEHVPKERASDRTRPLVGIGLTHPSLLRYHADEGSLRENELTAWFTALVRACLDKGWSVTLFTNGSPEDDEYLQRIGPTLQALGQAGIVTCRPRFKRPSQLASFISGLDLLLAHRLHANIAAYSYGIPHVGFSWDRKVRSFFSRMGRGRFVCTAGAASPDQVATLADLALQEGICSQQQQAVLAEARSQVMALSDSLERAVAEGRQRKAPASP